MGKETLDPGGVDEVESSNESREEEEVEEDAAEMLAEACRRELGNAHLWVEDRSSWLNHRDCLIVGLNLVDISSLAVDNSEQAQSEILGVHVGGE